MWKRIPLMIWKLIDNNLLIVKLNLKMPKIGYELLLSNVKYKIFLFFSKINKNIRYLSVV